MKISDELLKYAIENNIIDLDMLEAQVEMRKREELLRLHEFRVWQGENGSWYTYLPDEKKGRVLKKKKTKEALEDFLCEYYRDKGLSTFEDMFNQWIDNKLDLGEIQKQTYDRYRTDYDRFFGKTGFGKTKMKSVTESDLEDYIKRTIKEQELTNKAYAGMRTIIIGVMKFAKKRGYSDTSSKMFFGDLELSRKVFKKKVVKDEDSVFTRAEAEEVQQFLWENPSIIDLGILLVFQTGLRVGELAALQFADVSDNRLEIYKTEERFKDENGKYVFQVRESPKTDAGNRTVILDKEAIRILGRIRKINPFGEYMFMKNGERVKSRVFTLRLLRVCRKLGINARSMHKIRKTYATKLINGKVDEKIIIRQMGHTDINCTRNYYYYNDKGFDEAAAQIERALMG